MFQVYIGKKRINFGQVHFDADDLMPMIQDYIPHRTTYRCCVSDALDEDENQKIVNAKLVDACGGFVPDVTSDLISTMS